MRQKPPIKCLAAEHGGVATAVEDLRQANDISAWPMNSAECRGDSPAYDVFVIDEFLSLESLWEGAV
jgi:hypothetical protein